MRSDPNGSRVLPRGFRLALLAMNLGPGWNAVATAGLLLGVMSAALTHAPAVAAEDAALRLAQASSGYDPMQPRGGAPGYDPMQPRGGASAGPEQERPEGNPELGGLPDAPGAEETYSLCTACHSIRMVTQQSLTDARWDYLWDWMIREQGMPDVGEEMRETILDYLKTHYSAER